MSWFEIDFTYKVEEYGTVTLEADNDDEADGLARQHIRDAYPDAMQVTIDEIKEIN